MSEYGDLLRDRRLALGLSRDAVSRGLGISHSYYAHIERGERKPLTPRYRRKLMRTLKLTREQIERAADRSRPLVVDLAPLTRLEAEVLLRLARAVRRGARHERLLVVLDAMVGL